MLPFDKQPGERVLELGCGESPHPAADVKVDVRPIPGVVDFTCDLDRPEWPEIGDSDFNAVLAFFVLEHVSPQNTLNFLKQVFRILKPGGRTLLTIPNTEAQVKWIVDGHYDPVRGQFQSTSEFLFGTNDYTANTHRAYFSPSIITQLLSEAGFVNILLSPFGGESLSDLRVEAHKPAPVQLDDAKPDALPPPMAPGSLGLPNAEATQFRSVDRPVEPPQPEKPLEEVYNRAYFDNYQGSGRFVWDFPSNYMIAQRVLERSPESVLELGCGRGYVLKRLEDAGVKCHGLDVSAHASMTRVCRSLSTQNLCDPNWVLMGNSTYDLIFSHMLLEHIPEHHLPALFSEMTRVGKRGLHGVVLEGLAPNHDPTRKTLRSLDWWKSRLPKGHEVVDARELGAGDLPKEYTEGDGRIKLNLGSAWTMFWEGWTNIDVIDADNFARAFHFKYLRHDVRQGLPYATGVVDRIFSSRFIEHLTYDEGLTLLKECRRVIRPDGAMRLVCPNTQVLTEAYFDEGLGIYDEVNEGCAKATTPAGKLWSLLGEGHRAFHDWESVGQLLHEAGWNVHGARFRYTEVPAVHDILKETSEMSYGGMSLFVDATPKIG